MSLIGAIIIVLMVIIILTKSFVDNLSKNKYYILDINNDNKEQITLLLQQENREYCESMTKIEYIQLFPNDKRVKIYCNEKDINFIIRDNETSKLANYIKANGFMKTK